MSSNHKNLGELLLSHRLITKEQLECALKLQTQNALPLASILVNNGFISEELLLRVLAAQENIPAWHLEKDPPKADALSKLHGEVCKKYQVLPVQIRGDLLLVAMRNPNDNDAIDLIRNVTGMRVQQVLANEERLARDIDRYYGEHRDGEHLDSLVTKAMTEFDGNQEGHGRAIRAELAEEDTRPVVGLVNQMLTDAIRMRASDIHIEPRFDKVEIRFRLDGQLIKIREIPIRLLQMLIARIKIMAELDIVEYRIPQDGRISAQIDGRTVDLRVSVLPNVHGQRIVLRVLDKSVALKSLDELGFEEKNLTIFRSLIRKPYGMLLVTGPTGSGKTTTLYAALNEVKTTANNIMTCEDPVEYDIEGINQSQVNEKVGLTFASQLRAILRQDPDVILVGEIRDHETAETAIRAALTGHLVLSTLHCNDASSAIPRLIDMGIDPFLLSTSLIGVVGQRLVRRLCEECKQPEDEIVMRHYFGSTKKIPLLYKAVGCSKCHETGYQGRIAVHEIFPIVGPVASVIASHGPIEQAKQAAVKFGFKTLQDDVLKRVLSAETSLAEAKRVVFFDDDLGELSSETKPVKRAA